MRLSRRTPPEPPLDGYSILELLCFSAVWHPDLGRGRWTSWKQYLDDFRRLRPHVFARFSHRTDPLFGDRATAFARKHGLAALNTATDHDIYHALEQEP